MAGGTQLAEVVHGFFLADPAEKGKGGASDIPLQQHSPCPSFHPFLPLLLTEAEVASLGVAMLTNSPCCPLGMSGPGSLTRVSCTRQEWSSRAASGWDPPLRVSWNTAAASSKRYGPRGIRKRKV